MRNAALWMLLLAMRAGPREVPRDFQLAMCRSGCFGSCPIYTMTIDASGAVAFDGKKFTAASGVQRKTISHDAVKELVLAVERIGFFALGNYVPGETCPEQWTDYPGVTVTVRMNGSSHVMRHYHGCKGFAGESCCGSRTRSMRSRASRHGNATMSGPSGNARRRPA